MSGAPRDAESTPRTAASRVRVLIVEDHPLVREGLVARISAQPDLEVCAEATGIEEALQAMRAMRPDLMIVDLALKEENGLDLIKRAKADAACPQILVVSAYEESIFGERALEAGARGYVHKHELPELVIEAIRTVLRGELYVSIGMTKRLAERALTAKHSASGIDGLTDRELQIFELIGRGRSTRQIAEQLHRSIHTIESHREKIRAKLQLRSGVELVRHAVQWILENAP
ncbi:MAG TPA: response regulator transcription factor [Steroidobacteraceae bacterium]|nr:response regulator transcription factor [Steroidobacteraceae bacterium]